MKIFERKQTLRFSVETVNYVFHCGDRLFKARSALIQDYQLICCSGFVYFGRTIQFKFHNLKLFCINLISVKEYFNFSQQHDHNLSTEFSLILD